MNSYQRFFNLCLVGLAIVVLFMIVRTAQKQGYLNKNKYSAQVKRP